MSGTYASNTKNPATAKHWLRVNTSVQHLQVLGVLVFLQYGFRTLLAGVYNNSGGRQRFCDFYRLRPVSGDSGHFINRFCSGQKLHWGPFGHLEPGKGPFKELFCIEVSNTGENLCNLSLAVSLCLVAPFPSTQQRCHCTRAWFCLVLTNREVWLLSNIHAFLCQQSIKETKVVIWIKNNNHSHISCEIALSVNPQNNNLGWRSDSVSITFHDHLRNSH